MLLRLLKIRRKIGTSTMALNFIFWKLLRINRSFHAPVHFTSRVSCGEKIYIKNPEKSDILLKCLNISGGVYLQARNGIELDSSVHIAPGVKIISANHSKNSLNKHDDHNKRIVIKEGVWIGANAVILPTVIIGEGAVIGAGAVVTKDVQSNTVVGGVPAKVIEFL